jgi:hypothetical protein
MAQQEFEIEISPCGKVTVRTIGIKGPSCIDAAAMVARIIGQVESRQLTTEYYETEIEVRGTTDVKQRW